MAFLNKVMLIGRLTDNPDPVRTLPNTGNRVVKFRFAVGRSKKNPQTGQWENDPNPLYINCEAFTRDSYTKLVDLISTNCKKGSQLYIEGTLRLDSWVDQKTNEKKSMHKIVVEDIQFLDAKGGDDGVGMSSPRSAATAGSGGSRSSGNNYDGGGFSEEPAGDGDIPF